MLTPRTPKEFRPPWRKKAPEILSQQEAVQALDSLQPEVQPIGSLPSIAGLKDSFLERRFHAECGVHPEVLARAGILSFISRVKHTDTYHELTNPAGSLPPGLYRIRDEGGPAPVVTIKRSGKKPGETAETIDILHPEAEMLEHLAQKGRLVAVIEKYRTTYRLRSSPDCLLNQDSVRGLGDFIDLKADNSASMAHFLAVIEPDEKAAVQQTYLQLKQERGINPSQLKVWGFHEKFRDYIMGVVSGTLTPLGFLSATLASTDSKSAMIVALLSAGICDGIADSVATSQTTQSSTQASGAEQARMFLKTMAGKCAIPCLFIPIVIASGSNLSIGINTSLLGAVLLSATAAVQAAANERPIIPAVGRILVWATAATALGTALGTFIPRLLQQMIPK